MKNYLSSSVAITVNLYIALDSFISEIALIDQDKFYYASKSNDVFFCSVAESGNYTISMCYPRSSIIRASVFDTSKGRTQWRKKDQNSCQ